MPVVSAAEFAVSMPAAAEPIYMNNASAHISATMGYATELLSYLTNKMLSIDKHGGITSSQNLDFRKVK